MNPPPKKKGKIMKYIALERVAGTDCGECLKRYRTFFYFTFKSHG